MLYFFYIHRKAFFRVRIFFFRLIFFYMKFIFFCLVRSNWRLGKNFQNSWIFCFGKKNRKFSKKKNLFFLDFFFRNFSRFRKKFLDSEKIPEFSVSEISKKNPKKKLFFFQLRNFFLPKFRDCEFLKNFGILPTLITYF